MVSIIVPVFNVEKYLVKCIDSLLKQTYTDIEIILVNDGSTDESGKICDQFAKQDKRIKVIHKKNGGLSSARNVGLDIAQGEYISFVDSDDWIEVDFIQVLFESLIYNNADISQCGFVSETEVKESLPYRRVNAIVISKKEAIKRLYKRKLYIDVVVMWNKLYKITIFDDLRFKEGIIHEDEVIIHEVLYRADRIVVNESKLYHYLTRKNSIMNTKFNINRLSAIIAYEKRIEFLEKNNETELVQLTMQGYFRVLIGLGAELYFSEIDDKKKYIGKIVNTINKHLVEFKKNKSMTKINLMFLFSYRITPKLGFYLIKGTLLVKSIIRK